jgi:hypothetical protein
MMKRILLFALLTSILVASCIATKGDQSPILIGKNKVVNLPTDYYDNSSKVTIIYDNDNVAYIPKYDLSTYEQNFIDQSMSYHSQQYHFSKSEFRKLEQESVYLEEELKNRNISREKYNQRTQELDEEKSRRKAAMEKYDRGYNFWNGTPDDPPPGPGGTEIFYKIRITSEINVKNICNYSDDFKYPNIEFQKEGNAYVVYIYPYLNQEADLLIEEFKSSGKYPDAMKIVI